MKITQIIALTLLIYVSISCDKNDTETIIPSLEVVTAYINFGIIERIGEMKTNSFIISKTGDGVLTWYASIDKNWMELNKTSGEIDSKNDTIVITINNSLLNYGENIGTITIIPILKDVTQPPIEIRVNATINTKIADKV